MFCLDHADPARWAIWVHHWTITLNGFFAMCWWPIEMPILNGELTNISKHAWNQRVGRKLMLPCWLIQNSVLLVISEWWVTGSCVSANHIEIYNIYNIIYIYIIKGSWEAILPSYGQIEFWDLKWWRVVRHLTIHNKRIRSYAVDLDEGW